ncbi:MAG: NUDIX hydrolase [Candidatus Koribacter versatilis]|uniref:NUDIX hydrolase n=1 Tax=Candidatus Korobacter versatilis TaxID=658062 RepID=A0A932A929_9BACT|nr:NUDIX hydrolase [Candidatus Koribacter versatilis]
MKREYPDRPLIGVGAIIIERGRALVIRRATEPLKGEWSIPGGMLELGETLRTGVAREAKEETGLEVVPLEVLDVYDRIVADPDGRTRYHYVLIDYLCEVSGGELRAASDASEVRWITEDELKGFAIADSAEEVIRKGFDKVARS